MSLSGFLRRKAVVLREREQRIRKGEMPPVGLKAAVVVEGESGVRRIRMRDFQLISDAGKDFAGYDLGPSAPELFLGGLGSCLMHTLLQHAAWLDISLESAEVEVLADYDPRSGNPAFPDFSARLDAIRYRIRVKGDVDETQLGELKRRVDDTCTMLATVKHSQPADGQIERTA